jgi:hypothetical protein
VGFVETGLELLNEYLCHVDVTMHEPYFISQVIIAPVNSILHHIGVLLKGIEKQQKKVARALHIYRTEFTMMYLRILIRYGNRTPDDYTGKEKQINLNNMMDHDWLSLLKVRKLVVPPDNFVVAILQTLPLYFKSLKNEGTEPTGTETPFLSETVTINTKCWQNMKSNLALHEDHPFVFPDCWDVFKHFHLILKGDYIWEYADWPNNQVKPPAVQTVSTADGIAIVNTDNEVKPPDDTDALKTPTGKSPRERKRKVVTPSQIINYDYEYKDMEKTCNNVAKALKECKTVTTIMKDKSKIKQKYCFEVRYTYSNYIEETSSSRN